MIYDKEREFVITFLSARGTPIANRFEIWIPDRDHQSLTLYQGHSEIPRDVFTQQQIKKGEGYIGRAWLTGCPDILPLTDEPDECSNACVAIPIIEDGSLVAVVAMTL